MSASPARLAAWMNGQLVGTWAVERGAHRFTYEKSWLEAPQRRALSLSLPITPALEVRGAAVAHYFDNLLPDNPRIRDRLARRFRLRAADAFTLLQAIGRDCVGAVQLLPEGAEPHGWDRIASERLTETQVADILRAVPSEPVLGQSAGDDDLFRISIAGAQEKTALLMRQGHWHRPLGATPTTHILKLPLGLAGGSRRVDLSDSVANEWLCAQILHHLGLPVAPTEMWRFEDQQALVVTRFDRAWQTPRRGPAWIARLPQEDLCQALGYPPRLKYEKEGGPGMADCMRLLAGSALSGRASGSERGSERGSEGGGGGGGGINPRGEDRGSDLGDREFFALTQLTFWLMAATDGHAKNFSIFLLPADAYVATPLYDVLSIFPYIGDGPNQFRWRQAELALALRAKNAHYSLRSIEARHWHGLAMRHGGAPLWQRMISHVGQAGEALERVERDLPADFPPRTWRAISRGMRQQVQRFRDGLAGLPG